MWTIKSMRALPAGIDVRRAGPADVDTVIAFVRAGIEEYRAWAPPDWSPPEFPPERRAGLDAHFAGDEAWILLALEAGELVGVVSLAPHTGADPTPPPEGTIYLWQMFVTPRLQGSGLAAPLLDLVVAQARTRGFRRMTLWAAEGAAQARRFYEKEGWTLTGKRRDDEPFGLPIVEYELAIR